MDNPDPLEIDLFQKVLFCPGNSFSQSTLGQLSEFSFLQNVLCVEALHVLDLAVAAAL